MLDNNTVYFLNIIHMDILYMYACIMSEINEYYYDPEKKIVMVATIP